MIKLQIYYKINHLNLVFVLQGLFMFEKVEIYSKSNCSYCVMAKSYFESNNINYILHDAEDIDVFKELLVRNPAARTMPQIFINDVLIGGYTDLDEWVK